MVGERSSGARSSSLRSEQPGVPWSGTAVVESSALPLGQPALLELTAQATHLYATAALEAPGTPLPAVRGAHPCWGCPANKFQSQQISFPTENKAEG